MALSNGRLDVRLEQVSVKDKPLPPLFLNELKKQDLSREFQNDPEVARVMERLDTVEIRDGKVIIRSRPSTSAAPTEPATPAPPAVPPVP